MKIKINLKFILNFLSRVVSEKLSHRFLNLLSVLVATLEIPCDLLSLDKCQLLSISRWTIQDFSEDTERGVFFSTETGWN